MNCDKNNAFFHVADILGVLECVAGFGKLLPGTGMAKVGRHAVPYDR